eukprot:1925498-Rhodomonas_salina.1
MPSGANCTEEVAAPLAQAEGLRTAGESSHSLAAAYHEHQYLRGYEGMRCVSTRPAQGYA